jgi:hypothetical protein
MNSTFASLFTQAPGLVSSFNDIFNDTTSIPAAPPTPAALPAPHLIPSDKAGE